MKLNLCMFLITAFSSAVWLSASMGVPADAVDQPFVEEYIQHQSENLVLSASAPTDAKKHVQLLQDGTEGAAMCKGVECAHTAQAAASNTKDKHNNNNNSNNNQQQQQPAAASCPDAANALCSTSVNASLADLAAAASTGAGNNNNKNDAADASVPPSLDVRWVDVQTKMLFDTYGDRLLTVAGLTLYFICYMLLASVYFLLEYFRCFPQWRIQPGLWAKKEDYLNVLRHLLRMFFVGLLPSAFIGAPFLALIGITADRPLPDFATFAMQIFAFWVIEDIFQYFLHRMLHTSWMYKRIHKQHHDYQVPFALAATYAHPVEVAILGFCSFAGPVLLRPHLFVMVFWMIVQQTDACVRHSGYDFPFDPLNHLPLYGGPKFHDAHHEVFLHNYASRFVALDMLFGTYKNPVDLIAKHRAREARLLQQKNEAATIKAE